MKRKITIILIGALMITSGLPATVSANDMHEGVNSEIDTVSELKQELARTNADGSFSKMEKTYLEECTESAVIEDFIAEKLDKAVDVLNGSEGNARLCTLEEGQEYQKEIYDLGDYCQLIVELEDKREDTEGVSSRATSGSNTLWKGYGNRYFTAKATVSFSLGYATMQLRNHYTLSSKGIDERYGVADFYYEVDNGSMTHTDPKITDATARTVGASDVNMECNFTLHYSSSNGYSVKKKYLMESVVGFVDIDKADEQVKVKQSWTLTKL